MRPSPGVTVLQYFLMSLEQALSSLATRAVSFSRIVFPRFACAETGPTDKMASKATSPGLARNFTVTFIELPLMTCSGPGSSRDRRMVAGRRLRDVFYYVLIVPRK